MCLTSFGDDSTESLALPCRNDVMVDKGAAAPKQCLLSVEMQTPTAAGDLLPAGTASTAMRTVFPRPLFSWSLGKEAKKSNSLTNNQLAPPLLEEGYSNKIKANSVVQSWLFYRLSMRLPVSGWVARVALWGSFLFGRRMVPESGAFCGRRMTWNTIFRERYERLVTPYVLRLIAVPPRSQADSRKPHKLDDTRLWKLWR